MTENLSRQQRRQMMRDMARNSISPNASNPSIPNVTEKFETVSRDLQKLLSYSRYLENKLALLTETLVRMDILPKSAISETEMLYMKKEEKKKDKIKELLAADKTIEEYLQEITEDPKLLGFEKLNIHPIKDLNLNPFEVAFVLKELNPGLSKESYLELGKKWDLTQESFGFKKDS